ncbi:putative E3 ubiquitin-protein ligase LIN [Rutidosis leptorrhynchoides]|uniref:putative E3 ubiquitin-protein ligase LIN n=1 Tax=Rutidosis leptorrhynchoides TaxID=125765 RepID=UPI003A994668
MAMSLEDLLADESFKGRKSRTISRASTGIVSKRIPIYPMRDEGKTSALVRVKKTERAYSDANRYDSSLESPLIDKVKGRRSLDIVKKEKNVKRSVSDTKEKHIRRHSHDLQVVTDSIIELSKQSSVGEPALDELAIKAVISILNVHSKCFIKDQVFRISLHNSCLSVLNFTESKVISNLEEAMKTVERASEEQPDEKLLKKAALKLSVIAGVNSNDTKYGFTSGISNSVLSACCNLYLSVIYYLQKKERVAARRVLQVFIDSPFSARTTLVVELWDNVFHPHLLHLDEWYNQEVDFLTNDASKIKNLKKLKKSYDDILDVGTCKLALYYKDWLTDGVEPPVIPTIDIPLVSFIAVAADVADHKTVQRADDGFLVEDKMTVKHSLDEKEYTDMNIKQYAESNQDTVAAQEALELHKANALVKYRNTILQQDALQSTNMLQSLPISEINELSLKMLSKSVFEIELQQNEKFTCLRHLDNTHPQIETKPIGGDKGRSFYDIPQEYVCSVTGLLFKDPVTLETGQTYERIGIAEWVCKDNKTCPVTGDILEHHNIPPTNYILNRVIIKWKEEYSRNILASACQVAGSTWEQERKDEEAIFILEKLFTVFGDGEEEKMIGKQVIANGGLNFLIKRFKFGDMEEKTRVAALLLYCIKADSGCRINVTRTIEKKCLLKLLNCKEVKSIANGVLLLFELICLNRKRDVQFFLSSLHKESIRSSMDILLVFIQGCSPEQRPLVAILFLHLDFMVDRHKHNKIYIEKAVDTIISALDTSLLDEKVRVTCCRALLILGGRISYSGKVMTEDWILKKAGFLKGPEMEVQEDEVTVKHNIIMELKEEDIVVNDWLTTISGYLLGDRKKSFLYSLSRCLKSGHSDTKRVCLTTIAWLSSTLCSLPHYESRLSIFSVIINQLKENLKNGESVEHKILAAMSLLNFSKIPECRELSMTIADEITVPLRDLCEATWMAKELYALICQKD